MKKPNNHTARPAKAINAATKKPKDPAPDYCLTCRVPVGKCKGNCTKQQQKLNGGNLL